MRGRQASASVLLAASVLVTPALAIAQEARLDSDTLSEIVVTAQKRAQRIQDVPIAITAITQDAIEKRGFKEMGDYLLAQPSVSVEDRGPGRNQVVIRGISTTVGSENPTVAFYLGETPVTSGLGFGANGFPDLRTFDVNRVEVLRGPQGTLYGAGSMGGTVKVVPNEAQIGRWRASAEAGVATTAHGGTSNNVAAAVNVPLEETFAARITAYHYRDGGFIDNRFPGSPNPSAAVAALGGASWSDVGVSSFGIPARNNKDANSRDTNGGRLSFVVQPNDRLKIVLGALYQRSVGNGLPENLPTLGDYVQSRFMDEKLLDDMQLYQATINYDLGFASVTSATAYLKRDQMQFRDVSSFLATAPISLKDDNHSRNFSQELRIAFDPEKSLSGLLGGFYSHASSRGAQDADWHGTSRSLTEYSSALLGLPVTTGSGLFRRDDHNKGDQVAGFGEVSYKPIETVKLSAGLRVAHYTLSTNAFSDGAFNGGATSRYSIDSSETVSTPSFQVEFKPDKDQLYYARAAQGFRLGGPNQPVPSICSGDLAALGLSQAPASVKSDKLWSYEAGAKRSFADGKAAVNASAFYIDWTDIQTGFLLPNCGFAFAGNAGNARSQGVELDFSWQVARGLTLNGAMSFTDATLQQDSPRGTGVGGKKGDRVPGIPRWSVQGGGQYEFTLANRWGFVRTDARYISGYLNRFPGASDKPVQGGDFVVVDARFGIDVANGLQAELYATNLFDKKQLLVVDTELPDKREILGRPRTIGVTLRYQY